MKKPYVIIHTHTSLDGKIHAIDLPEFEAASRQYQDIALDPEKQVFNLQGYLNGRVTVEDNFTHYRKPEVNADAELYLKVILSLIFLVSLPLRTI